MKNIHPVFRRVPLYLSIASIILSPILLSGCSTTQQSIPDNHAKVIKDDISANIVNSKDIDNGTAPVISTCSESSAPCTAIPLAKDIKQLVEKNDSSIATQIVEPVIKTEKIDLVINNAQAREVFLALVDDTPYSMLMHPDVSGTLSMSLKGVTIIEALESIRDVYGYDFQIKNNRITIFSRGIQTRIFSINYLNSKRSGNSEISVSGSSQNQNSGNQNSNNQNNQNISNSYANNLNPNPNGLNQQNIGSRVSTKSNIDFWDEITTAVQAIIGKNEGRSVVASPHSGIMAVHANPDELRQVEKFLLAAQIAIERQVMLEVKIVGVELNDGFQSGIDWSALKNSTRSTGAMGILGGNPESNALIRGVHPNLPGFAPSVTNSLIDGVSLPASGSGLFGLAFATEGFQAVLGFLQTRGDVQILSSPRISALNNQQALLKVGVDEYFVTGVSGGTTTTSSTSGPTSTMPNISMASFFSGISLDVTPQIDDKNNITLHVHPSVTNVSEKIKQIDLGNIGTYKFPMASSNVNESDTVVKIKNGNIVAIGGLMQIESYRNSSGLPGSIDSPFFSNVLGNKSTTNKKKELVVLIRPTIINSQDDWENNTQKVRNSIISTIDLQKSRLIKIDSIK